MTNTDAINHLASGFQLRRQTMARVSSQYFREPNHPKWLGNPGGKDSKSETKRNEGGEKEKDFVKRANAICYQIKMLQATTEDGERQAPKGKKCVAQIY